MLMERIIGAFTFKREVYADVEHDTRFTSTAWGIVAAVALVVQIPAFFTTDSIGAWLLWAAFTTAITLFGFAASAYVIAWVGKKMFQAEVSFDEMVRTLGLAYVWNVTDVLGGFLLPFLYIGGILGLASWFIATREALDLENGQTIVTVLIGWVAPLMFTALAGVVLGLLFVKGA